MRRFCISGLIIFLILINVKWVNASIYNITYSCKDNTCIEGQTANWIVTIYNKGGRVMEYTAIELIDIFNNSVFAELKIPFNPLSSDRGDLIIVKQNEEATINLSAAIPRANYQQNLIYYPCFTNTITDSYSIGRYGEYESRRCYEENLTMPVIQCISDKNCDENEYCSFNVCMRLNCGQCQYIKNHTCLDYECCTSEQCNFDEICKSNFCQKLNCNLNEYIENRTCKALNCGFDEQIVNKICKKLNCSYNEFIVNHTCKKLDCNKNEFIDNNACKPCKTDEYAVNYTCMPLNCLYNESPLNHTCMPLNCLFFQEANNNACVNDKSVILKLILEIIAVIAIILFVVLDVRKFELKHKKL